MSTENESGGSGRRVFYGFTLRMKSRRRRASGVGGSSEDIVCVQESVSSGEPARGKQLNKFAFIYFLLQGEIFGTCDQ